jgi:hypothetical protein
MITETHGATGQTARKVATIFQASQSEIIVIYNLNIKHHSKSIADCY